MVLLVFQASVGRLELVGFRVSQASVATLAIRVQRDRLEALVHLDFRGSAVSVVTQDSVDRPAQRVTLAQVEPPGSAASAGIVATPGLLVLAVSQGFLANQEPLVTRVFPGRLARAAFQGSRDIPGFRVHRAYRGSQDLAELAGRLASLVIRELLATRATADSRALAAPLPQANSS